MSYDVDSLCLREFFRYNGQPVIKKGGLIVLVTVVKGLVVVVKSWVCLEGAYNGNKVCTRDMFLRGRGFYLGGIVRVLQELGSRALGSAAKK